jgi:predicted phosphodiesterase
MTKYYIISDIHRNLSALEAVLSDIDRVKSNGIFVCLGDLVGYGPYPNDVVNRIREIESSSKFDASFVCAGNHDYGLFCEKSLDDFNDDAFAVLEWTKSVLSEDNLKYLSNLFYNGIIYVSNKILFTHADPTRFDTYCWDYVFPDTNRILNSFFMDQNSYRFSFVGHAHLPQIYTFENDVIKFVNVEMGVPVVLENKSLVVVGSVGQPRTDCSSANWCEFDDLSLTVIHHAVPYDVSLTQSEMRRINSLNNTDSPFSSALIKRLNFSRVK